MEKEGPPTKKNDFFPGRYMGVFCVLFSVFQRKTAFVQPFAL